MTTRQVRGHMIRSGGKVVIHQGCWPQYRPILETWISHEWVNSRLGCPIPAHGIFWAPSWGSLMSSSHCDTRRHYGCRTVSVIVVTLLDKGWSFGRVATLEAAELEKKEWNIMKVNKNLSTGHLSISVSSITNSKNVEERVWNFNASAETITSSRSGQGICMLIFNFYADILSIMRWLGTAR